MKYSLLTVIIGFLVIYGIGIFNNGMAYYICVKEFYKNQQQKYSFPIHSINLCDCFVIVLWRSLGTLHSTVIVHIAKVFPLACIVFELV